MISFDKLKRGDIVKTSKLCTWAPENIRIQIKRSVSQDHFAGKLLDPVRNMDMEKDIIGTDPAAYNYYRDASKAVPTRLSLIE